MIFIVSLIGMLAGIFYMGFLMSFLSREEEDDEF
jgi:hypothetical protein